MMTRWFSLCILGGKTVDSCGVFPSLMLETRQKNFASLVNVMLAKQRLYQDISASCYLLFFQNQVHHRCQRRGEVSSSCEPPLPKRPQSQRLTPTGPACLGSRGPRNPMSFKKPPNSSKRPISPQKLAVESLKHCPIGDPYPLPLVLSLAVRMTHTERLAYLGVPLNQWFFNP